MKKKIVNQIEVFILEVRGRRPFYARPDKRGSGWLMMRKIEQLFPIVFVLLSAEFDF